MNIEYRQKIASNIRQIRLCGLVMIVLGKWIPPKTIKAIHMPMAAPFYCRASFSSYYNGVSRGGSNVNFSAKA